MKLDARKWNVLSGIIVVASSYIASSLVKKTWKKVGDGRPPEHPRLPTANLKTAMVVAGITGITSAAIKFVVVRFAGKQWRYYGGELPEQRS